MRRGFKRVQNLPVQSPYAKILNAHFYMTFRQLAGLCMDEDFVKICKDLIDVSLRSSQRQDTRDSSAAAVAIFQMAFRD